MEFSYISNSGTQVCFVFPFKLSLSCVIFEGADKEVKFDYDRWKEHVVSKLIGCESSSDSCCLFSWDEVTEKTLNSEFLPNCFLKGKIKCPEKSVCFNDCLSKSVSSKVRLKVSCVEIKLWEFGFGSVKIVSEITSDEQEVSQKLLSEMHTNFQKFLEPKIGCEIIKRCNFQDKDNSNGMTSFAEIPLQHKMNAFQHKNKDCANYNFDLLEPIAIVHSEAKDENDYNNAINMQSLGLHRIEIENGIKENNFRIYVSDNGRSIVSIFQQNSEVYDKVIFNEIIETTIVHKEFAVYLNEIGRAYEPFLNTYSDKIAKESIFNRIFLPSRRAFAWNKLQEKMA